MKKKPKYRTKYYYRYRSAATGNFIDKEKYESSNPATVYREKVRNAFV